MVKATHIFCDESGGSDRANTTFLTAAVAIVPADAERLIRRFRSAAKIKGEVKGTQLTLKQRTLFFELLAKRTEIVSAIVTCTRNDRRGGWAMGALREVDLYSHLLTEACIALPGLNTTRHLTITPDEGRFKKAELSRVGEQLTRIVADRHSQVAVNVGFAKSDLPGLQVADVIANTVFQTFGSLQAASAALQLLAPFEQGGHLLIKQVELAAVCPSWLTEASIVY